MSKCCYECGADRPTPTAKFCPECRTAFPTSTTASAAPAVSAAPPTLVTSPAPPAVDMNAKAAAEVKHLNTLDYAGVLNRLEQLRKTDPDLVTHLMMAATKVVPGAKP